MTDRSFRWIVIGVFVLVVGGASIGIQKGWFEPSPAPGLATVESAGFSHRDRVQVLIAGVPSVDFLPSSVSAWKAFVNQIYSKDVGLGAAPGQAALIEAARKKASGIAGVVDLWCEKASTFSTGDLAVKRMELEKEKLELETLLTRAL